MSSHIFVGLFLLYFHKCWGNYVAYTRSCLFSFLAWFSTLRKPCLMNLSILEGKKTTYILHNSLHVWVASQRNTIISLSSSWEETICLKDTLVSFAFYSIVIFFEWNARSCTHTCTHFHIRFGLLSHFLILIWTRESKDIWLCFLPFLVS